MRIEPIAPRETAAEACEKALRASILQGEIQPGERLPPERQLSERFGVTRITLRSALAGLAASGLLRTKQGSGHVVQDFRQFGGPDLLWGLAQHSQSPDDFYAIAKDLLRVRRHLAVAALECLIELDKGPDVEDVAAAIDDFERLIREGAEEKPDASALAQADVSILAAILDSTESLVLRLCLNPIVSALRNLPQLREAIYVNPKENLMGWRGFLEWLKNPQKETLPLFIQMLAHSDEQSLARIPRSGLTNSL
jgi:DNA-binding FadR family transcriptional regulator